MRLARAYSQPLWFAIPVALVFVADGGRNRSIGSLNPKCKAARSGVGENKSSTKNQ